jgi:hypothetical protein
MGIIISLFLGIIIAVISRQLADEFKEWTPWIVSRLIRRAVASLPEDYQARNSEEWCSHVNDIPGYLGKIIFALGLLSIGQKVRPRRTPFGNTAKPIWQNPYVELYIAAALPVIVAVARGGVLRILAPSLLIIMIAAVGFIFALQQKRILNTPVIYLAFVALAGSIQLTSFLLSSQYLKFFYVCEFVNNILLCIVAFEIVFSFAPARYVKWWGILLFGLSVLKSAAELPIGLNAVVTYSTDAVLFIAGTILLSIVVARTRWLREQKLVVAGLIALVLGDLASTTINIHNIFVIAALQFSSLPGLLLLSGAGSDVRAEKY